MRQPFQPLGKWQWGHFLDSERAIEAKSYRPIVTIKVSVKGFTKIAEHFLIDIPPFAV